MLFIFDLDDTLIHDGFDPPILCDDTIKILSHLKFKNHKIAIASFNSLAKFVYQLIPFIADVPNSNSKEPQLREILNHFNINPENCSFFDDLIEHIETGTLLGIKSKLVDWKTGITWNDLKL